MITSCRLSVYFHRYLVNRPQVFSRQGLVSPQRNSDKWLRLWSIAYHSSSSAMISFRSWPLYSSKESGNLLQVPSSTTQISLLSSSSQTLEINRESWLTITTPPVNSSSASAKASILCRSKGRRECLSSSEVDQRRTNPFGPLICEELKTAHFLQ